MQYRTKILALGGWALIVVCWRAHSFALECVCTSAIFSLVSSTLVIDPAVAVLPRRCSTALPNESFKTALIVGMIRMVLKAVSTAEKRFVTLAAHKLAVFYAKSTV